MSSYFNQAFFTANRQALRKALSSDVSIVITANGQLQRRADNAFPFSQDSSFWYLTGLDQADLTLVMDRDEEYIIAPELSDYQNIFDGSLQAAELSVRSGIKTILVKKEGWQRLRLRLRNVESVATLGASPAYIPVYGMYTNPARQVLVKRLKAVNAKLQLVDIRQTLAHLRVVKQGPELTVMRAAIDLTNQALKLVDKQLSTYKHEYEVEALITQHMISHGAVNAWKPTVGAGANSCILHSSSNQGVLRAGDLMVVDIGAEVEHYCSDITRTFALNGSFNARQQEVYNAVSAVQGYGFSLQKPGASIRENEKHVEAFMGEQLMKLGLIKKPERSEIRRYFPHATSHFLGLDPHDAGDYDMPLQPGMVLTVEPGIYIPEEKIGIRIEDDVLVTDGDPQLLSR